MMINGLRGELRHASEFASACDTAVRRFRRKAGGENRMAGKRLWGLFETRSGRFIKFVFY
jgi:hypothetical protein